MKQRFDIIQVDIKFIPQSEFITEQTINLLFNKIIKRKPQRILQDWEYDLARIAKSIIILERDQLSSPSKFFFVKDGLEKYMTMAYEEFKTVYENISFSDFCLFTDFVNNTYPNLYTTYYFYNKELYREDNFFHSISSNTEFYIGSVFEYKLN